MRAAKKLMFTLLIYIYMILMTILVNPFLQTNSAHHHPGAPIDSFLSDPLKSYFRLSGVPLKLCRFILGRAMIFLSLRSF